MSGMQWKIPLLTLIPVVAGAFGKDAPAGYGPKTPFDAARDVLESKCLECHTKKEAKGGLIFETREGFITGGDSGIGLELISRLCEHFGWRLNLQSNPEHGTTAVLQFTS